MIEPAEIIAKPCPQAFSNKSATSENTTTTAKKPAMAMPADFQPAGIAYRKEIEGEKLIKLGFLFLLISSYILSSVRLDLSAFAI